MAQLNALQKRRQSGVVTMAILLVVFTFIFYVTSSRVEPVIYSFYLGDEWKLISEWKIGSKSGVMIFLIFALIGVTISFIQFKNNKKITLGSLIFGFGSIMAFLSWAAAGKFIPLTGLLQAAVLLAVPLIFGSMAGLLCEKSGVINIAIEGQLLFSAFVSAVVASLSQNLILGLISAPIAGALVSWILAYFSIRFQVNQVILGFVINVLVLGLTNFFYTVLLVPYESTWNAAGSFSAIPIPVLSKIPVIGPILFNQTIIVYLMYLIVTVIQIALFKSKWGLRTRAIGELPIAADSVGIDVNKLRFRNVLIAGAVAGVGGAVFTIGAVGVFSQSMTAGAGFIALACLIFGKWNPKGALIAALFFGFTNSLQSNLSIAGVPIPSEFMLMIPYIATIIAVSGLIGRVRAPAADGIPYLRGTK
ncbi:MAG: ABC transporter permease [Actinobacteria bacterium BACL4 MAG-120820-bin23]|jgi:general nucleoside transport system permease protein|uniref:ABC transporter permease n=1 Tax=Candidatus Nanopelagicus sp. TaxID=2518620 RepID=UPI000712F33F|nr:MAG: ABC transporter permease [Actinobacteria bacterium BACL4 MAG-121022-bin9]KRO50098.1 MAG: ABC transporter permease [Actinobacteria bacterium BACL4 MAG-120820-bin23]KRO51153.1 MAG: ABC transporter permease [Actinobacteria bacterium BACL4 MAG-121001-bin59]KRO76724.1 MAG: ABC transporter permease [Actinobacteria bacterium BACL4 MAG-120920-bin74]KRO92859.1 MAG: ABC transporter permease [Actinobacteria bacterium BACL4 MAG-120507-bin0]MDA2997567.1 ABC transporter permease [Actinomycetota bact